MMLPFKCPLCSRTFRTPQGRRGHLTFKHGQGKSSVYTEAIRNIIEAHREGFDYVKEKRKKIPRSALDPEKRKKALMLDRVLRENQTGREKETKDMFEDLDLGGVDIEEWLKKKPKLWIK